MQRHTPYHLAWRTKEEQFFNGDRDQVVGRQRPAYHHRYRSDMFGGLCSMSRPICMIFVADLIARRLRIFISAVAVTPRLCSMFLGWLL